ncbi:hypothetical protein Bca101_100993 [Brassica carinata]
MMTMDEHDKPIEAAQTTTALQKRVDVLQSQITDMHRARQTTGENPGLSSEVQSLNEKLHEHSKQLEQSAEKLSQLQSENTILWDQNQALNATCNKKRRFNTRVQPMGNLNTPSIEGESDSELEPENEAPKRAAAAESSITAYLEQIFSKRFDAMQSMVERLPGVAPPIRRSNPDSYADTPFVEDIASVEMPRKYSFPSIKMYDGTGDPDDHIARYKQRMLAVALPKESREATMSISSFAGLSDKFVEQFASSRSLEKTSDGLYVILQHRVEPLRDYIARFNQEKMAVPECSIPTAIFALKRGLLPDGGLYKELTIKDLGPRRLRDQRSKIQEIGDRSRQAGLWIIPRTRGILEEPMSTAPHGLLRSPSKLLLLARQNYQEPYQVSVSGLTDKQMGPEYSKETSSEDTSDGSRAKGASQTQAGET